MQLHAARSGLARVAVPNTCPSLTACGDLAAGAKSSEFVFGIVGRDFAWLIPGGILNAPFGFVLLPDNAFGIGPQQHAVACPLGNLRAWDACVQPCRYCSMPQVVWPAHEWPMSLSIGERHSTSLVEYVQVRPLSNHATSRSDE
jgi:hypothetical protein